MTVNLSLFAGAGAQFFDNNGLPLIGGLLYSYSAGTTTQAATYTSNSGSIANSNPIVLDASGRVPNEIWLTAGSTYKFILQTSAGVQIGSWDNIAGANDQTALNTFEANLASSTGSSLVGYNEGGTSAVTITVQAKLQQTVSVKDFGAKGDGTTNDLAAFVAAIAASNDVYVPPGTYLCNGNITLKSNFKLHGAGAASIIKWGADYSEILISNISNVIVEDLLIDGGGQTTNIYTGIKGCSGVGISQSTNVKINRVTAQNMGIINQSDPFGTAPTYDVLYSGYGFNISARNGTISNIRITNCTALRIAGAGFQKGDGFYVEGFGSAGGTDYTDVVIENCYVSVCGRHCYTVAGGSGQDIPSGVVFNNCYGENSALDGCDIESGYNVILNNCIWHNCGNNQTYYNPASEFGSTYTLLAAIAVDNNSKNIVINNNTFDGCYYGFTYGASENVAISNCVFRNSTVADINQGLATGIQNFRLTNCSFETALNFLNYYRDSNPSGFFASGCSFSGLVVTTAMRDGVFSGCRFLAGIQFQGGGGYSTRNTIVNCTFEDFAGNAIYVPTSSAGYSDFIIEGNVFYGTGNLVDGIRFAYQSATTWTVSNNKFIGLTGAGVNILNGSNYHYCDVTGNSFESCANGILVSQAINQSIFANNSFVNISSNCISISGITSANPMLNGPSIMNNMACAGCVNGISISLSGGSYDYTMLVGNNVHACSGTKWSLASGNGNGVVANNITT